MNAGAAIAGKQNRYMRRFQAAGATDPDHAKSLDELGCRRSFVFGRMLDQGVFVEVSPDRYYMDLTKAAALRSRRGTVALVMLAIAVVVIVVVYLTR